MASSLAHRVLGKPGKTSRSGLSPVPASTEEVDAATKRLARLVEQLRLGFAAARWVARISAADSSAADRAPGRPGRPPTFLPVPIHEGWPPVAPQITECPTCHAAWDGTTSHTCRRSRVRTARFAPAPDGSIVAAVVKDDWYDD